LIKAILNKYKNEGLQLIEIECQHMTELMDICNLLNGCEEHFIIYCDDLSFEVKDPRYKILKVIPDGSIGATPDNVLIYATSNHSEATEEKISLSKRFSLWLAFHPFNQEQYLKIVDYWIGKFVVLAQDYDQLHKLALRWALEHDSRSGRTDWQFTCGWTGKSLLENQD